MAIYTVHQPPLRKYESVSDPERFAFVRDGFSFWAFLFGPLWMLRHRMWLVLLGYVIAVVAFEFVLSLVGASTGVSAFAGLMLALLIGMEAGTLRRFTLGRRRWRNLGVIVGDDRDSAERRFFDSWINGETLVPLSNVHGHVPTSTPAVTANTSARPSPDVIGLFPQPGTRQ